MRISDWSSDVCSSDLLAEHARGPLDGSLRRGPGLARETAATGRRNGRGVGHAAAVDQVVAGAGDIADDLDRGLAGAARVAAPDPRHAVIAAARLGLLDGRDRIRARHGIAPRQPFGHLAPAELAARRFGPLLGTGKTGRAAWGGKG